MQIDRHKSIGGSEIAAVLGVSKWRTPCDVWLSKISDEPPPEEDSLPLRFGTHVEEFVAQEYTRATGRKVQKYTKTLVHHNYPYITGNVDRLVVPEGAKLASHRGEIRTDRLLECKTSSAYAANIWGESGTTDIPLYYLTQVYWYMLLTGCKYADVAVLIGNSDFRVYEIPADEQIQQGLLAKAVSFWERCVLGGELPQAVTAEDIAKLYPKAENRSVEATEGVKGYISSLLTHRAAIKGAEILKDIAEMGIKDFMGSADTLTVGGEIAATWRENRRGTRIFRLIGGINDE